MELLYLLSIIVGVLCFFYGVKYIFRDTNKLYYYNKETKDDKILEHQTDNMRHIAPIRGNSTIESYKTIILSELNILKNTDKKSSNIYKKDMCNSFLI